MATGNPREKLLLRLMHLMADTFKEKAVLKGGMGLRLLNSPRFTQDVDYVFPTNQSRKIILAEILKAIEREGDMEVTATRLNSRDIHIRLQSKGTLAVMEVSVVKETGLPPQALATSVLADQYQLHPQVITVMSLEESYAHKIAAGIERDNLRDIYDISIYQGLTPFDRPTLRKRLDKIEIRRAKPRKMSWKEAAQALQEKALSITAERLRDELNGLAPDSFLQTGLPILKNSLNQLCHELGAEEETP